MVGKFCARSDVLAKFRQFSVIYGRQTGRQRRWPGTQALESGWVGNRNGPRAKRILYQTKSFYISYRGFYCTPRRGRLVLPVTLGPHHKHFGSARSEDRSARGLRAPELVGAAPRTVTRARANGGVNLWR